MAKLAVSLACLPYDRLLPLLTGEVGIDGADLTPVPLRWPMEVFSRMLAGNEFDIAEMSITHAFVYTAQKRAEFVTLPIFPSRMFRHGFVFVNTDSGIRDPKDLAGRRIGIQGHQTAACVWVRGILRNEFGVDFSGVTWIEGGVNQRGLKGGAVTSLRPTPAISVQRIRDDQMISEMLADGEVDALINPEVPHSMRTSKNVARLFPDYHAREREFYKRTGVFPIMHVMVMRRSLHEAHPWLANNIYKACEAAKAMAMKQARYTGALPYMLPWMDEQIDEIDNVFGDNFWPYGLAKNRATLEMYSKMLRDDGYLDRPVRIEDIFVPVQETVS